MEDPHDAAASNDAAVIGDGADAAILPRRWLVAVAVIGAAGLAAAAIWSVLISTHVVIPAPPGPDPAAESDAQLREFYVWFESTVPARQAGQLVLLIGLAALGVVARVVAWRAAASPLPRLGSSAVVTGAIFWAIAAGILLGANRAVGLLAVHENPIQPTVSISFTLDSVAAALQMVGSVSAGAGLIALTRAHTTRSRQVLTGAAGAGMLLLGALWFADAGELTAWLQLAVGAVLLPSWLISSLRPALSASAVAPIAR